MYSERKNEKADSGFFSAKWRMVPRSFCFLNFVLKGLFVWFTILAPFTPIQAYSRISKSRTTCSNNHLDAHAHFSYKHFVLVPITLLTRNLSLEWPDEHQFLDFCFPNLKVHRKPQLYTVPFGNLDLLNISQVMKNKLINLY